jgi:hypothetical protein
MSVQQSGAPIHNEQERIMLPERIKAATGIVVAVAEVIKEVGRAPAGSVYLALSQYGCSLDTFWKIVSLLESAGAIKKEGDELVWIGPK